MATGVVVVVKEEKGVDQGNEPLSKPWPANPRLIP